jgi:hypothetical protein
MVETGCARNPVMADGRSVQNISRSWKTLEADFSFVPCWLQNETDINQQG